MQTHPIGLSTKYKPVRSFGTSFLGGRVLPTRQSLQFCSHIFKMLKAASMGAKSSRRTMDPRFETNPQTLKSEMCDIRYTGSDTTCNNSHLRQQPNTPHCCALKRTINRIFSPWYCDVSMFGMYTNFNKWPKNPKDINDIKYPDVSRSSVIFCL